MEGTGLGGEGGQGHPWLHHEFEPQFLKAEIKSYEGNSYDGGKARSCACLKAP